MRREHIFCFRIQLEVVIAQNVSPVRTRYFPINGAHHMADNMGSSGFGHEVIISKNKDDGENVVAKQGAELCLAGVEGIEPSPKVLETSILPLNYTPKL